MIAKKLQMQLNQASDLSQLSIVESMIFIKCDWMQEHADAISAFENLRMSRLMIVGMDAYIIAMPLP